MIISGLWKYFGDTLILKEINCTIGETDRIGLVGANGVGKTTFLRILAGEETYEKGTIDTPRNYRVGYLSQTVEENDITLWDFLHQPFSHLVQLEREIKETEVELAKPSVYQDEESLARTMSRYGKLQQRFEDEGGYDYLVRIKSAALGLGFAEDEWNKNLELMSGGEKMRAQLARLLLSSPDLLVLDEPSNHLDMDAIEWLENFLAVYPRALVVVSHDRYFLDKVANKIWEIQDNYLYQYKGNYSAYVPMRQLRIEQAKETAARQQEEVARIEGFIRKFGAGTRARQAKSLEKKLEKMEAVQLNSNNPTMKFSFAPRKQTGNRIVDLTDIKKAYDGTWILKGVTGKVKRGDRVALLGPNGCGKTTLLRILAGHLEYQGGIRWGTGVELGYFSQDITFSSNGTVLEEIYDHYRSDLGHLRSVLARFLFRGDDVFKSVSVLSGGERNRLALAKLFLDAPNFLLMDEPTNHLDIYARDALEQALVDFGGTLLFVSHDRYFVDKLATKIWVMADGIIHEFDGNFSQYKQFTQEQMQIDKQRQKELIKQDRNRDFRDTDSARDSAKERALLEERISCLEGEKRELEEEMAAECFYQDSERSARVVGYYKEIERELAILYDKWDELVLQEGEC